MSRRLPFRTLFGLSLTAALAALALPASVAAQGYGDVVAQGYGDVVAAAEDELFVGEALVETRPGAVYVYRRTDGAWEEAARIEAPGAFDGDHFGRALVLSGGDLLVGATSHDDGRGAVFHFRRDGSGGWEFMTRIQPEELVEEDFFGRVAAGHGDVALFTTLAQAEARGSVYALRRAASGAWELDGKLVPEEGEPGDFFGTALAVRGDLALVGAPPTGNNVGVAYLFRREAPGRWTQLGRFSPPGVDDAVRFGTAVALEEGRAYVGAPFEARGTGAVYVFEENPETGRWRMTARLFPFDGPPFARFGSSLTLAEGELWVGSPGAERSAGRIYRLSRDADGRWTSARKLGAPGAERGDNFGASMAVAGGLAVVGLTGDDFGTGTAVILEREADAWRQTAKVWSEPAGLASVTGGAVACQGGTAAHFECDGVDLLAFVSVMDMGGTRGVELNDLWGWTDPETGREIAIVGRLDGASFVDVTDPENPVYLGDLPKTEASPPSTWRDMKVYEDHVFIVADGAGPHGMQVFDLTRLREVGDEPVTFEPDAHYTRIHSAHNIVINEETGFAYTVGNSAGGETCGGGLHMVDISDPTRPTFAGCFAHAGTGRQRTGYTHDAQCVIYRGPDERYQDREICFGANETALSIADVTDKSAPVALSVAQYPNVGYTHQGWLTEDHRYFFMDDELDELQGLVDRTRTLVWDVVDLEDPVLVTEFFGTTTASDHNLYIVGDLMYQSNYQAGLRVIDISDPEAPEEVAWLDTVPFGENEPSFGGSWSNYPFFESGIILVTSGDEGLFVLRKREAPAGQ